jgi:hypothetical protein
LAKQTAQRAETDPDFEILWGVKAIAAEIGLAETPADIRRVNYLLERGHLPAEKIGRRWATTRARLRRRFAGVDA